MTGRGLRKWDGESTFKLEACVCKLRGKTAAKEELCKKAVSLVAPSWGAIKEKCLRRGKEQFQFF